MIATFYEMCLKILRAKKAVEGVAGFKLFAGRT